MRSVFRSDRVESRSSFQSRWRSHRAWLVFTVLAALSGVALFRVAARSNSRAPGGTRAGLVLGVAATMLIVFTSLLGARRRYLGLPLGSMTEWLRAHQWLGSLALVLGLLHAGASVHGPLGIALMALLWAVSLSGLFGAWLQRVLPPILAATTSPEEERTAGNSNQSIHSDNGSDRVTGMQRWLHAWLLIHVPLAMALLVLLAVHALTALRY